MSSNVQLRRPSAAQSYDPERLGRTFDDEIARLRAQVELSWSVEQRRLSALGFTGGLTILEPGCGPGFVTKRLARWLPASSIIALDLDARMLARARTTVDADFGTSRIMLLQASMSATGLRSQSVDAALSRYVFQHLSDPVAAAVEICRVLRPGGIHVAIDVDDGLWGLAEPCFPDFREWHARRARRQRSHGGNRFCGRRLGRIMREAGYARVDVDLFAYHSDDSSVAAFAAQLDPEQFLPLLDEGQLTLDEYLRARAMYSRFCECPDAFLLSVGFIVRAEAPR